MNNSELNPCKTCGKKPESEFHKLLKSNRILRLLSCCSIDIGVSHKAVLLPKYNCNGVLVIFKTNDSPQYAELCLTEEWNRLNPRNKNLLMCDWPCLDYIPLAKG